MMKRCVTRLLVLFSIVCGGQCNGDDSSLEWDYVVKPSDFFDGANYAYVNNTLIQDEFGGSASEISVQQLEGQNLIRRKSYILFLDSEGKKRYQLEKPHDHGYGWLSLGPEGALVLIGPNNTHKLHHIKFNKDGTVSKTITTLSDREEEELVRLSREREKPQVYDSVVYVFALEESLGIPSRHVIRKRSTRSQDSLTLAPILFSGFDSGNAIISWESKVGATHQVQKSTDLENWTNVGLPITGTGNPMNYSEAALGGKLYLRVVNP